MLYYLPNFLSLLRIPLAFFLFLEDPWIRLYVILLAMATDAFDGYLARKLQVTTKIGTLLDPIADKFFMAVTFFIFYKESLLTPLQIFCLFTRDLSVLTFGIGLFLTGFLKNYSFKAIYSGKVFTALQFFTLIALLFKKEVPFSLFFLFICLGILSFFELLISFFNTYYYKKLK